MPRFVKSRGEKGRMRLVCVGLVLGAASCPVIANAQETQSATPAATPAITSRAAGLLQKFKTEKVFWRQAEVGEQLVALQEKSAVSALLPLLQSEERAQRCNAGRVLAGLGDERGFYAVLAELKDSRKATGSARLSYQPPQFRRLTVHEAAALALQQIQGKNRASPTFQRQ